MKSFNALSIGFLIIVLFSLVLLLRFGSGFDHVEPTTPKAEEADKNLFNEELNPNDTATDIDNTKKIDFPKMLEQNALLYIEKEQKMYCSQKPFGEDGKYFYTWIFCQSYESDPINGGYRAASGFSIPTRFEYDQNDLSIIGYKQPLDGSLYDPSMKELFPEKFYKMASLSNEEVEHLEVESKDRFMQSLDK